MMIKRLLIANRGEIACRVIKTAKKMGITAIAVTSAQEDSPLHAQMADEHYCLGDLPLENCYLNQDKIILLAKQIRADAIHPGYGFLSENASFSQKCEENNLIFIGPSSRAITLMGKKDDAKIFLRQHDIPVVPGFDGEKQDNKTLQQQALKIGLPVLIKAASGGGGKGMRKVFTQDELAPSIEAAKREGKNSFGDDKLIIEKYLPDTRHIEVQIIRDKHGNCLHLYERDCSVQRRHQKIIEEAPAPIDIPQNIREQMYQCAKKIADSIDYHNAGTIEFLFCENAFYFLEMNTRIQVEHPISEMITGVDLVEWQIHVANGDKLPLKQNDIQAQGHAIEARIYAENPRNQFLPTTGTLHALNLPKQSQSVRIDLGVQEGDNIGIHFDPMLAKLSVHGKTRQAAIDTLNGCLHQFATLGLTTNIDFLIHLINQPPYQQAEIVTNTLDNHLDRFLHDVVIDDQTLCLIAAIYHCQSMNTLSQDDIWQSLPNWRMNHGLHKRIRIQTDAGIETIQLQIKDTLLLVHSDKSTHPYTIQLKLCGNIAQYHLNDERGQCVFTLRNKQIWLLHKGQHICAQLDPHTRSQSKQQRDLHIQSPMPGVIRQIFVKDNQSVKQGEKLIALEAMKMEHTLTAHRDGKIKHVHYKIGDQVEQGKELIAFHV